VVIFRELEGWYVEDVSRRYLQHRLQPFEGNGGKRVRSLFPDELKDELEGAYPIRFIMDRRTVPGIAHR